MSDLKDRFRRLDDLGVPDVWRRVELMGPKHPHEPGPSPARRAGVIVLALAVAAAGIGLAVVQFDRGSPSTQMATTPKENGVIYYRIGGGDGPSWWESIGEDGSGRSVVFPPSSQLNHDDVAWSPDERRIAFANTIGSRDPGIYTSRPDGSDAVRLTDEADDLRPSWSPDGTRIAFTRPEPGADCAPGDSGSRALLCASDLYVMNADGSNVQPLIATEHHESQPVWSPDGTRLAFVSSLGIGDTRTAVFIANEDGSGAHPVSSADGGSDFSPSWSPDGSRLVFASIRNEDWGIWIVNADGSGERRLAGADGGPYLEDPVWSPDGTAIAFVGDPQLAGADGAEPVLLVMDADGSNVRILARARSYGVAGDIAWQPLTSGSSPTPAPAGELLAMSVMLRGPSGPVLAVMQPDGSGFRQVTGYPDDHASDAWYTKYDPNGYASDVWPTFSPDGRTIAFVRQYGESKNSLCTIDVDGSNFRIVVRDLHGAELAWSPHGATIAFYSERDGGIHLIDADGANERALWPRADGDPNQDSPSWSPDGTRVYYASGDVRVARSDGGGAQLVADLPRNVGWVAVSPDGRRIALAETEPGGNGSAIWLMEMDGTHLRQVTTEGNWYLMTWSPDGSKLLIEGDDGTTPMVAIAVPGNPDLTPVPLPEGVTPGGTFSWRAPPA